MAVKGDSDGLHTIFRFECIYIDFLTPPVAEACFFDHFCLKVDFPITQTRRSPARVFFIACHRAAAAFVPQNLCPVDARTEDGDDCRLDRQQDLEQTNVLLAHNAEHSSRTQQLCSQL